MGRSRKIFGAELEVKADPETASFPPLSHLRITVECKNRSIIPKRADVTSVEVYDDSVVEPSATVPMQFMIPAGKLGRLRVIAGERSQDVGSAKAVGCGNTTVKVEINVHLVRGHGSRTVDPTVDIEVK